MNPLFREIRKNEIEFLKEMLYEAIFVEPGNSPLPKSIIDDPGLSKYIKDFGERKGDVCLVATVHEELVGACWGRFFPKENAGYGFIDESIPELSIAIHRGYRNHGLGSRLIERLIEHYRSKGVESISLSVDKKNPAYQLYQRLDFEVYSETEKSAIMKLEL